MRMIFTEAEMQRDKLIGCKVGYWKLNTRTQDSLTRITCEGNDFPEVLEKALVKRSFKHGIVCLKHISLLNRL